MVTKADKFAALRKKAASAEPRVANVWKPEKPGDEIAGTVVKIKTVKGRKNEDGDRNSYMVLVIADERGEERVVSCGTLLEEELREQGVAVGKDVAIRFVRHDRTGSGNKIGVYTCAVE